MHLGIVLKAGTGERWALSSATGDGTWRQHSIGHRLTYGKLFETAATKDRWFTVQVAAVLAASTTCRGVELKGLRWQDIDLDEAVMHVRRSKTAAGHRSIPLNADALQAVQRLRERAETLNIAEHEHYLFPACERQTIKPLKPQAGWRTAWRSLIGATARQLGRHAADTVLTRGGSLNAAKRAYRKAAGALAGFRFHDLRHQAVTEMAENGASDAALMAMAGHMSRRMMEHYSHVRMAAKREVVDKLASGLMKPGKPFVVRKVS
jgi:integrase